LICKSRNLIGLTNIFVEASFGRQRKPVYQCI
jgi:hypothetical protein